MAGLLSGQFGSNPFYQGFDANRNALAQFGIGLMTGKDLKEGVQQGVNGALQGKQTDDANAIRAKEEARIQSGINQTVEFMRQKGFTDLVAGVESGALDVGAAWGEALKRGAPQGSTQDWSRLNDGTLFNQRTGETQAVGGVGGEGTTEFGLTPIWGQLDDGSFGYGVQGKDGTFKQVDTGELNILDPRSLAGERAAGTVQGRVAGQAGMDAGPAAAEAQRIALQIDDLKSHPGLDEIFGKTLGIIPNQWGPTVPGSNKANAMARIEQMSGNAFLNGRTLLKGGGAITDFESQKAEAAFARLSTAQSKEEFLSGLADFQAALEAGVRKLQQQSTSLPGQPPGGGAVDYRSKYGLD